jgi:ankyrin repeat protein
MTYKSLSEVLRRIGQTVDWEAGIELTDPNQKGGLGNLPLGVAARWGDIEAMKILLAAGARIDGQGDDGFTALHDAVGGGHIEAVNFLLAQGASPDIRDEFGDLPSELARILNRPDIAAVIASFKAST